MPGIEVVNDFMNFYKLVLRVYTVVALSSSVVCAESDTYQWETHNLYALLYFNLF